MPFLYCLLLTAAVAAAPLGPWLPPATKDVQVERQDENTWRIRSTTAGEFTLESSQRYDAKPGDAFEVELPIRVDFHTRAMAELVCYDAANKEIPVSSSRGSGRGTGWETVRRIFPVRPGTASVRARLRGAGRGELWLGNLEFGPRKVDPYQTGALISKVGPRNGLVLSANLGVLNRERIAGEDRDGDGKWALVLVDLDDISEIGGYYARRAFNPDTEGEDWRSSFRYRPNEMYWFDGAVLKSDSVTRDRAPDFAQALHYRERVHAGSYRAIMNGPGRAVAVSVDGKTWKRFEGGQEAELGDLNAGNGFIEFWVDACYRDPVSQGPVYFDYVRLLPADDAPAADRLFAAALQRPAKLSRGSVEEKRVTLRVQAPRFDGGKNWPVRCGLPIPRGELAAAERVELLDAQGKPVPSQNRTLATWEDGSVKWLYLDFRHDFSVAAEGRYTVAYGNRVKASAPVSGVQVRGTGAGIEVDTGAIRFRVPKERFGILEDVRLASGKALQSEPVSVTITEASGKIWRALDLPVEKLEIEQAGPLHAVIVAETKLAPSGKPSSGFYHRARIHAYVGSPLVQVDYFVANTDSRDAGVVQGSMASMIRVRSIALNVKPAAAVSAGVSALAEGNTGAVIQRTAETAVVQSPAGAQEKRTRVPGWVAVQLESGGSIQAGVEAFREQFPKALRWGREGLEIALWAAEGGDYEWFEGVGKTHRVSLYYGDSKSSDAALLAHGPVMAVAEPAWYTGSGALGPLVAASQSGLPLVEKTLDANMRATMIGQVGVGFDNYGDHDCPGYVEGSRIWINNEIGVPAAAMVLFARTGDRDALRIGLAGALHFLDVDMIHYSSVHADWVGAPHVHSHDLFPHHTAGAPDTSGHAGYVQELIWYSYFTGEPVGLAGAQGLADRVLRTIRPESNVGGMERVLGHPLMTLTDLYEATWDERYLRGAARLVDWALKWEHPTFSGFLTPVGEAPGFYAGNQGFAAGTIHAGLIKFNSWAKAPEVDAMLERDARWTVTFPWRPPAGLVWKAGFRGAPGYAQYMGEHMRLMAYAYRLTQDPVFLAVPYDSLIDAFVANPRPINPRALGRIYNYLPWFLTTVNQAGNPEPDRELVVLAPPEAVEVGKGGSVAVTFRVRNYGRSAVSGLRVSFQPRLDFKAAPVGAVPVTIPAGGEAEFRYTVQAPERINLTCETNREAYAHWSAVYQREGHSQLAHRWLKVSIRERK